MRNEAKAAKRDDPAGHDIHHHCGRRSSVEYVKQIPAFIIAPRLRGNDIVLVEKGFFYSLND
jgi:hypothetical protein